MEFLNYKKYVLEYMKCANDPWYFIETYFKPDKEPLKLLPHQKAMIMNFEESKATIIKSCRQSGKSLITLAYAYWAALFHQKSVLIIVPKSASYECLVKYLYKNIEEENVPCKVKNKNCIEFADGGLINFSIPRGTTGCGRSFDMMILDDMAFMDNIEEFWNCVYPIVSCSKNSKIIVMSTPHKPDDLFYTLYLNSIDPKVDNGWTPMEISWWDLPSFQNIEKVKSFKKMCGDKEWRTEYEGRF